MSVDTDMSNTLTLRSSLQLASWSGCPVATHGLHATLFTVMQCDILRAVSREQTQRTERTHDGSSRRASAEAVPPAAMV